MIDPQSRENFNRLWSEEAAERRDQFLGFLKRATEDAEFREKNTPVSKAICHSSSDFILSFVRDVEELTLIMMQDMQAIRHDFTQYWKKAPDAAT